MPKLIKLTQPLVQRLWALLFACSDNPGMPPDIAEAARELETDLTAEAVGQIESEATDENDT